MNFADKVKAAGVVGAGGAGFPTHVKATSRVDTLIANGAECEPVLVTDQWLVAGHAREIVDALREEARSVGAKRTVLAIKRKYHELADRLNPLLGSDIELFLLDDFYPSGDEHVTVHEVTGRVVPEGGIPLEAGTLVQNVATLLNCFDAMNDRPVIEKHVTVAGEVARPGVYIAPIGTPASEVIAAAGGTALPEFGVVEGGPMMGFLLGSLDRPVTKTTSGYLVLPLDHPVIARRRMSLSDELRRGTAACCQCRMCTDLCPRYLLGHRIQPHLAMRAINTGLAPTTDMLTSAFLCSQCGVCEAYACPMGLSPRRVYGEYKERLQAAGLRNPLRDRPDAARDTQAWVRVPKARLIERLELSRYLLPRVGQPERVPTPWETRVLLQQHIGSPAMPVVREGDHVTAGTCIADIPEGKLGARIHASIDGVVSRIEKDAIRIVREA